MVHFVGVDKSHVESIGIKCQGASQKRMNRVSCLSSIIMYIVVVSVFRVRMQNKS